MERDLPGAAAQRQSEIAINAEQPLHIALRGQRLLLDEEAIVIAEFQIDLPEGEDQPVHLRQSFANGVLDVELAVARRKPATEEAGMYWPAMR